MIEGEEQQFEEGEGKDTKYIEDGDGENNNMKQLMEKIWKSKAKIFKMKMDKKDLIKYKF